MDEILSCGSFLGESQFLLRLSHSFSLRSSGKDKLHFSTLRASVVFWVAFHTKKRDPFHLSILNMTTGILTKTADFIALTEISDRDHTQKVQNTLKATAFNCSITKGTKYTNRTPVFNFTSM